MGLSDQPNSETLPEAEATALPETQEPPSLSEGLKHDVSLIRIPPQKARPAAPTEAELLPDPEERLNHRSPDQLNKARKRQAVFLQKRRKQKKRQVMWARMRGLVRVFYALFLIAGLYGMQFLPIWTVSQNNIQIEGTTLLQARHLLPGITPALARPIYRINPIQLEAHLKKTVPLLNEVHIRRHLFPTGLYVAVTEKPSWATLYSTESAPPQYWLHTDGTTTPVAQFYQVGKDPMPSIGQSVKVYGEISRLKTKQRQMIQALVQTLTASNRGGRLLAVDVRNPQEVWALFDGYKARLGRADSLLIKRSQRILDVAPALASRKASLNYVDLRWNNQILLKQKSPEQIKQEAEAKAQQAKLAAQKAAQAAKLKASQPPKESPATVPLPSSQPGVVQ